MAPKRICIVGSGNWGSAIAKIIGHNVKQKKFDDKFENEVPMYMYEEMIDGKKLTEIVNTKHENIKYLPGFKIPENVIAIPDVAVACKNADVLVFVLPHQFVRGVCKQIVGHVKKGAIAVSMIKGFAITDTGIELISHQIKDELKLECAVLMGANLATEVASEQFCETTIGCKDAKLGQMLKELFEAEYFRVTVVDDRDTVEVCGALKNVVGIGSGIVDGLGFGDNTKAAVIRLGLMEMIKFAEVFFSGSKSETFFESCGIADLVATCHGGRNRMLGEAIVKSDKNVSVRVLEKEILKGQSFQGPRVAREVFGMLEKRSLCDRFPLFVAVHKICAREMNPASFIDCLREHPEHL
ncbi:glycerol-3-phosphate dehydrogenase [NAD(+)], cytoplasmic-like isoform X2 [Gigantopelta aegis]|uniref:glycerol-3-phosphate dehydrogenase [NAD(+)], cytoplasmic-like isoform X2 n=1 Tax=Gigantopelta aegis TaxID=1735272 RepID=UPI001B889165|nr:glycerol-3-phosphate dehydrogenase [NAD(+)], cytoplasmic-like isoform X2 [Gigantopelta aegis]